MKFPIWIIATEKGQKRQLLKISKVSDGGLTLTQKEARLDSPAIPSSHSLSGGKGNGSHISVHASLNSKTTNTIAKTIITPSGRQPPSKHHTSAIKVHNQFALIYTRRCSAEPGNYEAFNRTGGTIFDFGSYDPDYFSLVFAVFVGPTGKDFLPDLDSADTNLAYFDTPLFRIVLLWSYLDIPAGRIGTIQDLETFGDENTHNVDVSEPGLSPDKSLFLYRAMRSALLYEFLNILNRHGVPIKITDKYAKSAVYYRYGRDKRDRKYVRSKSYPKNQINTPNIFRKTIE